MVKELSLIHISEPTRQAEISYAVLCLKKKKKKKTKNTEQKNIIKDNKKTKTIYRKENIKKKKQKNKTK